MREYWEEAIKFFTDKGVTRGLAITYIIVSDNHAETFTRISFTIISAFNRGYNNSEKFKEYVKMSKF